MLKRVTNAWNEVRTHYYWSSLVKKGWKLSREVPENQMDIPIDFVVTWVDSRDPAWQAEKEYYEQIMGIHQNRGDNGEERYRDWDLFRYWFRAVEKYAPWVRHVYLVTCGHVPEWLNLEAPKLKVVKHTDFIPQEYLPTFNSNAIEINMHRIPGLSEHFVYFNDDVFLNRPTRPEDFFWNGEPNYSAIASPLKNEGNIAFYHMCFSVWGAIKEHYEGQVTKIICDHPEKWFAEDYGGLYEKNLIAARLGYLPGMYFTHLAISFRKTDFEKTWQMFPELMDDTSAHKFRTPQDATHQLISLHTIMEGEFHPVSIEHHGMQFWDPPKQLDAICEAVEQEKNLCICINDSPAVSPQDFLYLKQEIGKAMQRALPKKCSFEK